MTRPRVRPPAMLRADQLLARLRQHTDPMTVAILELHVPRDEGGWELGCGGDDFGGYGAEAPEWPCRTIETLARLHGIDPHAPVLEAPCPAPSA